VQLRPIGFLLRVAVAAAERLTSTVTPSPRTVALTTPVTGFKQIQYLKLDSATPYCPIIHFNM